MKPLNDKDRLDVLCIVVYQEHGSFIIIQVVKKSKHHANDRLKKYKKRYFRTEYKEKAARKSFHPNCFYRNI